MREVQDAWPQGRGHQHLLAHVKRSNADEESTIVAFESPSLAFISLCCRDLALQICLLRFYILFHGDGLQVVTSSATCTGQII